jgi:hypothetical protein
MKPLNSPLERGREGTSDGRGVFVRLAYQSINTPLSPLKRGITQPYAFYSYAHSVIYIRANACDASLQKSL